jgi:DNA-binding transcriptional ArsR family regulator
VEANGELAVFQALADPTRHAIFERLKAGPLAVGELAAGLPVSRPAVSQHLKVLKRAGLVDERRSGTRRVYRIEPQGVWALRQSIDRMWEDALEAFRTAVEREQKEER